MGIEQKTTAIENILECKDNAKKIVSLYEEIKYNQEYIKEDKAHMEALDELNQGALGVVDVLIENPVGDFNIDSSIINKSALKDMEDLINKEDIDEEYMTTIKNSSFLKSLINSNKYAEIVKALKGTRDSLNSQLEQNSSVIKTVEDMNSKLMNVIDDNSEEGVNVKTIKISSENKETYRKWSYHDRIMKKLRYCPRAPVSKKKEATDKNFYHFQDRFRVLGKFIVDDLLDLEDFMHEDKNINVSDINRLNKMFDALDVFLYEEAVKDLETRYNELYAADQNSREFKKISRIMNNKAEKESFQKNFIKNHEFYISPKEFKQKLIDSSQSAL